MSKSETKIAVIIASTGRPVELSRWASHIHRQALLPDMVVYSIVSDDDIQTSAELFPGTIVIKGKKGATFQRNRGLEVVLKTCDVIAFFDDDYVPSSNCLSGIVSFFNKEFAVVGANGTILADGINSAGLSYDAAMDLVRKYDLLPVPDIAIERDLTGLYGCNMVFRSAAIGNIRFDESLPLYAWQEDIDFSSQVGRSGRIVKTDAFAGVHQGVKYGRTSGLKVGYSQIANPIYLYRKGTMSLFFSLRIMIKNIASNHVRVFKPEAWVDRAGRLKGNWHGIIDFFKNRLHPERIKDF